MLVIVCRVAGMLLGIGGVWKCSWPVSCVSISSSVSRLKVPRVVKVAAVYGL